MKLKINENKSLTVCLIACFVFASGYLLSGLLCFRNELSIVFFGFFLLTLVAMIVNNWKIDNKTLSVAFIGAIIFTTFVVFCAIFVIPDRNIYNLSTCIQAAITYHGLK